MESLGDFSRPLPLNSTPPSNLATDFRRKPQVVSEQNESGPPSVSRRAERAARAVAMRSLHIGDGAMFCRAGTNTVGPGLDGQLVSSSLSRADRLSRSRRLDVERRPARTAGSGSDGLKYTWQPGES